ncbi:MAG: ArsR family transcriptional regulator [Methanocalculaceae archaeon]|jgi:predicted hydrocarbon binding protein|nr:ArsR family transcriptional regulator [Methanocalculaceae archaeon]
MLSLLKLFSSDGVVTAISSPVRNNILFLIRDEGEISFSRIMEYTGLSKSTVSAHVNSLIDAGLIASRSVPGDARKKMYYLIALHLADIQPCHRTGDNEFRELIRQCYIKYDSVDYRQIIPHIIQVALIEAGIRIDPIMMRGGEILGESISVHLVAEVLEKTIENVILFWIRYGLGDMRIRSTSPLRLEIYKCYECMVLPKTEHSCCVISCGVLTAIFSSHFKQSVRVVEIECMTQGYPSCCFEIDVPKCYRQESIKMPQRPASY